MQSFYGVTLLLGRGVCRGVCGYVVFIWLRVEKHRNITFTPLILDWTICYGVFRDISHHFTMENPLSYGTNIKYIKKEIKRDNTFTVNFFTRVNFFT